MGVALVFVALLCLLGLVIGVAIWALYAGQDDSSGPSTATGPDGYLTFQQAQALLSVDESALKALIVAGELQGYREGATMKFRLDELEAVRAKRTGVEVRKAGSPSQEHCPFCHDQVQALEQVVCVSCLARHHEACWDEHTQCATCGALERFTGVEQTEGRGPRGQDTLKA